MSRRDDKHCGDEARSAKLSVLACVIACLLRKGGMTSMWDISNVLV